MKFPDLKEYEVEILRSELKTTRRAMELWRTAAVIIFILLGLVTIMVASLTTS